LQGVMTVISETPSPEEGALAMLERWRAGGGGTGGSLK
jgi:hypothetical protein